MAADGPGWGRAMRKWLKGIGAFLVLAAIWLGLVLSEWLPPQTAAQREALVRSVHERARRALAIDSQAIYAHGALARVEFLHWRWSDALRSFDRALETNPSD